MFLPTSRRFAAPNRAVWRRQTLRLLPRNSLFGGRKTPSSAARPEGAGPMRPAPPPHIRSSAAPRPAPRSRGARPAMAPVGERLAAAVARAIEGHDCTRRAPQVRPWRTTAADKASSARTRLELHERSSSQPVRAKKPPPPSAHPRHAPARVDRRGRASAPPPRAPRARRRRRRRRSVSPARHRRRASPRHPSPDAPGADGTPAKAEQRPLQKPRSLQRPLLRHAYPARLCELWDCTGTVRSDQSWRLERRVLCLLTV